MHITSSTYLEPFLKPITTISILFYLFFAGLNNGGIEQYRGRNYLFSWQSNDPSVRSANWDWFNARNYCRKRCMDLVSIETQDEYQWLKQRIGSKFYIILKGANTTGAVSTDTARVSLCAWEHSSLGHAVSPVQANKQYFYTAPALVVHSVLSIKLFLLMSSQVRSG